MGVSGDDMGALEAQHWNEVQFWNEFSKTENQYSKLEDLFRTHPFSKLRAKCLEDHIETNFHEKCSAGK